MHTFTGRFVRNKGAVVGAIVVLLITVMAVFAPLLVGSPTKVSGGFRKPPSSAHWFGTDQIGRDMFARVVYGARTSLTVAFVTSLSVLFVGVTAGAAAGWFGGKVDTVIMRIIDVILAFPSILLSILIITALGGSGLRPLVAAFVVVSFGGTARLLRGEIARVRNLDFVEAARATGASDWDLVRKHVIPNSISVVAVTASGGVSDFVLGEAALSFLGKGIQEPRASWGLMLARSRSFFEEAPHLLLAPGFAILLMALSFVLIGDGIRDALDPRADSRRL